MSALPEVKPTSLFVAMPCYGGIEPAFVSSLLRLQRYLLRLGVHYEIEFLPGESLITRARNRMVYRFLNKTAHTHLLFLDVDLMFDPTAILRLIGSGHEVVAAPYAKKREGDGVVGNLAFTREADDKGEEFARLTLDDDYFAKAQDVGTGCMLIARTALEKIAGAKGADGEIVLRPYRCDLLEGRPQILPFFDCGSEDRSDPESRYLSEDYWFCRLWQSVGGDVWLDLRAKIAHVGRKTYTAPSLQEQIWGGAKA